MTPDKVDPSTLPLANWKWVKDEGAQPLGPLNAYMPFEVPEPSNQAGPSGMQSGTFGDKHAGHSNNKAGPNHDQFRNLVNKIGSSSSQGGQSEKA